MENQPKLNSSKEVIAFLAERFPQCFSAEGEARPLKVGIFQDLVARVEGEMNLSKTQLRSALRLYTSSWRYLYGIKPGATRVDLDGNPCGELDEQHVEHARKQLEEAKARVQAQRAEQQAKKREAAAANGQEEAPRRERKPRPAPRRHDNNDRKPRADKPAAKAPRAPREEPRHTPVSDINALSVGQALKVKAGNNAMDATVLEITKDGVRVQLTSGHAFAVDDITRVDQIPVLKEETQHATVSERVTSRFTRSHYRKLDLFYDLYNLSQKRRFERYQYALKVLERPMDFTGTDTFNLDRSKAPWPKDEAELNALWDGQTGQNMVDVIGWRLDDVVALIKGPKGSKLQKLEKQNVSSIIIDLRSNGGGALTEAVSLSGLFIPSGPVVQVRDNNGKVREDADNDGVVYYKGPLVVLVDRFSASASEIFAAAMQDYGRALIVGEPTFGKGTVQQYRSLNRIYDQMLRPEWPALGSVQYTIQKFYRVNGGSTQRKGVTPDIMMPTGTEETETGEKFEDNALPWDSINAATYVKAGDMTQFGPELLKAHNDRIAKDPEFQYIMKDIARFNALKDKRNIVSLNYAQREKENNEDDATRLARINDRFKREGKPLLKKLDDLPKDYQEPDPYLDETVHIALDLANQEKEKPAVQPAPAK
ncbi:hypothetical protein L1887_58975 [Cichorium endivia]|nr:hypothetical protein L1887_58975 [Cichorium endivia]